MRYEILNGLPAYGDLPIQFDDNPTGSEGLVVRFYSWSSSPWIGNFRGGLSSFNCVLDHPNQLFVIVIARGEGYVINPETRKLVERFGGSVKDIFSIPEKRLIVVCNLTEFEAIDSNGHFWKSKRISSDGFKDLSCNGCKIIGKAWEPGDRWVSFSLDVNTGEHQGGALID